MNESAQVEFSLTQDEVNHRVVITQQANGFVVCVGESMCLQISAQLQLDELSANIGGHQMRVRVNQAKDTVSVFIKQQRFDFEYKTTVEVAINRRCFGQLKSTDEWHCGRCAG